MQRTDVCFCSAVRYVKQAKDGEDLRVYAYELPEGVDRASNLEYELHDVTVTDVRSAPQPFSLQENGFKLEKLEVPKDVDWDNEEEVSGHMTASLSIIPLGALSSWVDCDRA